MRLLKLFLAPLIFPSFLTTAWACSPCEDEVNILGVKGCVPNVNRCPPKLNPPIAQGTSYCNFYSEVAGTGHYQRCKNCNNIPGGDVGKGICAARGIDGLLPAKTEYGDCKSDVCGKID